MAQTVEELVALGLSEAEAKRVINRKEKAAKKDDGAKARAEKALPKAQAELDHAVERIEHWQAKAEVAQKKVDRNVAIVEGKPAPDVDPDVDGNNNEE